MKHLQLLIKPSSSNCNMKCSYCFYKDECKSRETYSYGFMKADTAEILVKKALDEAQESCTFGFQGGEPMLAGMEFYERFVAYVNQYKKTETKVNFCIQTNGTLINDEWAEFFCKNQFLVGISIDGISETHDKHRITLNGEKTFQRVMRNAQMLQKKGVAVNILCVLTKQSAKKIESIYQYLKKQGFHYHQYIPCLDPLGEERGKYEWSLTPKEYAAALKKLFHLWYIDISRGNMVSIREFDNWLGVLRGYPPESCSQVGRCSIQNIVEANGDIFPCDFYVLDKYKIANIKEESFKFASGMCSEMLFFQEGLKRGTECPSCRWYSLCRGGCRRDYVGGTNYFCEAYKEFFEYAIEKMVRLSRG